LTIFVIVFVLNSFVDSNRPHNNFQKTAWKNQNQKDSFSQKVDPIPNSLTEQNSNEKQQKQPLAFSIENKNFQKIEQKSSTSFEQKSMKVEDLLNGKKKEHKTEKYNHSNKVNFPNVDSQKTEEMKERMRKFSEGSRKHFGIENDQSKETSSEGSFEISEQFQKNEGEIPDRKELGDGESVSTSQDEFSGFLDSGDFERNRNRKGDFEKQWDRNNRNKGEHHHRNGRGRGRNNFHGEEKHGKQWENNKKQDSGVWEKNFFFFQGNNNKERL